MRNQLGTAAAVGLLAAIVGLPFLLPPPHGGHEPGEPAGLSRRDKPSAHEVAPSLLAAPPDNLADPPPPAPLMDGVVIYPVDGQKQAPLSFPGHETPDPIPDAPGGVGGYPITATFPPGAAVKKARATLEDAEGREIEAWTSSPEKPANRSAAWAQRNTICIIAKKPLLPGKTYAVSMAAEVDGKRWSRAWKFTTAGEDGGREKAIEVLVKRLNDYREAAGLKPLAADPDLSAPCTAHARYLEKNIDAKDLDWNDEDAALPGYSAEGRQVARRSSVNAGAGAEATADWAVASFLTRQLVLDPGLRKLGVGAAARLSGGYFWVIDAQGEREHEPAPSGVVLFPAPEQKGVPTAYPSGENPLPIPDSKEKTPPGYAVTAQFPQRATVEDVDAHLTDDADKTVDAYLSTPARPAIKGFTQQAIGLIPKAALRADALYTVEMSAKVGGEAWRRTWTFRTAGDSAETEEALAAAALKSLNAYRRTAGLQPVVLDEKLSRGCHLHALYLVKNIDRPAVRGLGMHDEDPKLPGATPEGRRAGKSSVISQEPDAAGAVDGWIDTLFHRVPLLDPDLKKIGYGGARLPDQNWISVLDAESGK
jgi:uncharacterized protein YkwD